MGSTYYTLQCTVQCTRGHSNEGINYMCNRIFGLESWTSWYTSTLILYTVPVCIMLCEHINTVYQNTVVETPMH